MEIAAAKLIGAGLAVFPLLGVGIGLGMFFASVMTAVGRNPSAAPVIRGPLFLYFALIEAIALFALGIALIILYG